MNIQQLRQSLKLKWLNYCEENRPWLVKMRIWRSYDDGVRRPSSGYILATLSVLEPQLKQILPFILDLNNNPDQIVVALGLHFNPDEELRLLKLERSQAKNQIVSKPVVKIIPENIPITPRDCDSAVKTVESQNSPSKLPQENKQVLLRITPDVEQKRQSISVVAVATPVHYQPSAKQVSQCGKTPRRSPLALRSAQSLTIINTDVPTHTQELNHTSKFTTIPVPEVSRMSPGSNARSLPSWIDEFCPGIK